MGNEGDNLSMVCQADGNPSPLITRYKYHKPFPSADSGKMAKVTFEKLTYKDSGMYYCEATNAVGRTRAEVEVIFSGNIKYFIHACNLKPYVSGLLSVIPIIVEYRGRPANPLR